MKVYFTQVERILDTLPTGYYLGTRIPVRLSDVAETSFIDIIAKEITVSFPQIEMAMSEIENEGKIENIIRNLLYHEVSHAILTPSNLCYEGMKKEIKDVMNIIEDERIETVLRHYYYGVNFKENVELINNWKELKETKPRDPMDVFYRVVRFHSGKPEWVMRAEQIVEDHSTITSENTYVWDYMAEARDLYYDIKREFPEMSEEDMGGSKPGESDSKEESGSGETKSKDGESEELDNTETVSMTIGDPSDEDADSDEATASANIEIDGKKVDEAVRDFIESIINSKIDEVDKNNEMTPQILSILRNFNKKNSGGSAIASYSGIINPRLIARRNDYRYFDRKSTERGANKFCSIHINLFLDESGSYRPNVRKTNQLIYALAEAEKIDSNFTFDIVYCGMGERIVKNKCDRRMSADGGNDLDDKIYEIYRHMQKPNTYNYNIVLFDGDAFTDSKGYGCEEEQRRFSAFNHSNCTIISDYDNQHAITKYAPSAKQIFTHRYVSELQKNIMSTLQLAFR